MGFGIRVLLVFCPFAVFLFDRAYIFVCCFHHSFTCADIVCLYHDLVFFHFIFISLFL